jgi:ABC-type transport system involved in multi-copper enzyme maturation permease subunit
MLQSLGPFASLPGILVGLLVLALILLVGRFLLSVAWRLVILAAVAVTVLWVLGILGFQTGVLAAIGA